MPLNAISNALAYSLETVWIDASRYQDAERQFQELQARNRRAQANRAQIPGRSNNPAKAAPVSSIVSEIAQARQKIQKYLKSGEVDTDFNKQLWSRVQTLENEKAELKERLTVVEGRLEEMLQKVLRIDSNSTGDQLKFFDLNGEALKKCIRTADNALSDSLKTILESKGVSVGACKAFEEEKQKAVLKIVKVLDETMANCCQISASNKEIGRTSMDQKVNNGPTDDDVDLFGSDEETEEETRVKEERLKAYADKKSKKPALVAKSSVVLDIKPWDDETDMKSMEVAVRKIQLDGLVWGASKLVPLAYGIKKLQIIAIVEDDKVSIDALQEEIEEIDSLVQSVDIAAFNKL